MNKDNLISYNAFAVSFFTFAGYYVLLSLFVTLGMGAFTRSLTIPIRIGICLLCLLHFLFFRIRKNIVDLPALLFYLFSMMYTARVVWELMISKGNFHLETIDFLLYFLSFAFIPFVYFLQMRESKNYKAVFYGVLISSLMFAVQSYFLFGQILGQKFGRISMVGDVETISPLAFSYCASLLITLSIFKIFFSGAKQQLYQKTFYIIAILLSLVPLFLGSSRGSILAIICSIIFLTMFKKGLKATLSVSFWGIVGLFAIYFVSFQFGSNLFGRFLGIFQDISQHSESAYRLVIWKESLAQFATSPIFGNSLESTFTHFYPHNIFIESLITTGIFGFLVLVSITGFALYRSVLIVRFQEQLAWIPLIFIQGVVQHCFSGGIYSAIWFWASLGLVFSTRNNFQKSKDFKFDEH